MSQSLLDFKKIYTVSDPHNSPVRMFPVSQMRKQGLSEDV